MTAVEMAALPLAERYIISKCHLLVEQVTSSLEAYNFGDAGRQIYEFLWDEYADWYIEISKTRMKDALTANTARMVLVYVWDRCMRILHPFMPFLTEALWQLSPHSGESLMIAPWPRDDGAENLHVDSSALTSFGSIQTLIRSIRMARAEYNVEPGKKIAAFVRVNANLQPHLDAERATIALLGRVDDAQLQVVSADAELPASLGQCVHLVVEDGLEAFLPMAALVDRAKEIARLSKQAEKIKKDISVLEARLQSKGFTDKAPEAMVEEVRQNVAEKREQLAAVEKGILAMST